MMLSQYEKAPRCGAWSWNIFVAYLPKIPMLLTRSFTPPTTLSRFSFATSFKFERLLLTAVAEAVFKIWLKILVMVCAMLSPFLAAPMLFIWIVGKATDISGFCLATLAAAWSSPLLIVSDLMMTFLPPSFAVSDFLSCFWSAAASADVDFPESVNWLFSIAQC